MDDSLGSLALRRRRLGRLGLRGWRGLTLLSVSRRSGSDRNYERYGQRHEGAANPSIHVRFPLDTAIPVLRLRPK